MTATTGATADAVVFDLGNVLIRWDPRPAIAAGVGEDEARRFLGAHDFDFQAWNHAQDAGRPWPEAEEQATREHPHWRAHILAYRRHFGRSLLGPITSSVEVLEELHGHGVPLVALTNWSAELFPHARERFGFLSLFDDIVVSGEVGVAKPDPEIFEILADRVGPPLTRCLFVDDSPANVAAAQTAGLDAVVFTEDGRLREELRARALPVASDPEGTTRHADHARPVGLPDHDG